MKERREIDAILRGTKPEGIITYVPLVPSDVLLTIPVIDIYPVVLDIFLGVLTLPAIDVNYSILPLNSEFTLNVPVVSVMPSFSDQSLSRDLGMENISVYANISSLQTTFGYEVPVVSVPALYPSLSASLVYSVAPVDQSPELQNVVPSTSSDLLPILQASNTSPVTLTSTSSISPLDASYTMGILNVFSTLSAPLLEQSTALYSANSNSVTIVVPDTIQQSNTVFSATSIPVWEPELIDTFAWYDASEDTYLTLSGENIDSMQDRSGNSRNGTKIGAGTLTKSSINGKQAIQYPSDAHIQMPIAGAPATRYMIIVQDDTSDANSTWILAYSNSTAYLGVAEIGNVSTEVSQGVTGGTYKSNGVVISSPTRSSLELAWRDGAISAAGWTSLSGWTSFNILAYGASWVYDGKWGEAIILDYPPSEAVEQKLEGYLAHKWGYASKLPEIHPYRYLPPTQWVLDAPLVANPYATSTSSANVTVYPSLSSTSNAIPLHQSGVLLDAPLLSQTHTVFNASVVSAGPPEVLSYSGQFPIASGPSTFTISLPASVDIGDLLLIFCSNTYSTTLESENTLDVSAPIDWEVSGKFSDGFGDAFAVLTKIADGSEAGVTLTVEAQVPEEEVLVQVYRIGNWYGSIDTDGLKMAFNGTEGDPPELVTGWGSGEHLYFACGTCLNGDLTSFSTGYANFNDVDRLGGMLRVGRKTSSSGTENPSTLGGVSSVTSLTLAVRGS